MKVKSNANHLEKLSGKPCFDLNQSLGILQQNAIGAEIPNAAIAASRNSPFLFTWRAIVGVFIGSIWVSNGKLG